MMSKKMAELEDDFREFKAHTERRFVSLDMSIRAYRLEEDQRHEERIRRYDELKNLLLSLIQKSSSPVQSSRPITTKVPTKPTECAPSYGDFGCLSPNNMTDFEEDEKEFENTRSVVKFFDVGTDEENNKDIVFNDVGGIVYDTWADARLKHGSYFLLDRITEDGWYFHDESRLSKEPLCRSNLEVHLQFHVDRLETRSQVKTWDPGIKFGRSNTLRTRYKGTPRRYLKVIQDMYEGAKTRVRTTVGNTDFFPVEVGLHQGSAISPYLFTLILDEISRGIQENIPWCMIFADDIVLIAESAEELNNRLESWRKALEDNGLRVSREKKEYLRCDYGRSGRIDEDVTNRIKTGWVKWKAASGITKAQANRVEVAELRMLRWTSGKTMVDMIPNGVFRVELGVASIIDKMMEGGLRWFGHVKRRPQTAPVRRVEAMLVEGSRRRGISGEIELGLAGSFSAFFLGRGRGRGGRGRGRGFRSNGPVQAAAEDA
ncbi:retrovirus-related pol polyprotein LINE-1 [Tanacetum coccineum]